MSTIQATPANRFPPFDVGQLRPLMPNYHVWDSWFVMTEEGQVADIHGFRVLVALTRPLTASSGEGEKIGYFYSKDGVHYHIGGMLFPQSLYADAREWSGSTILRKDGRLQTFYTIATGVQIDGIWQTSQRFATAIQSVSIEGDGDGQGLHFAGKAVAIYRVRWRDNHGEGWMRPGFKEGLIGVDETVCSASLQFKSRAATLEDNVAAEGKTIYVAESTQAAWTAWVT